MRLVLGKRRAVELLERAIVHLLAHALCSPVDCSPARLLTRDRVRAVSHRAEKEANQAEEQQLQLEIEKEQEGLESKQQQQQKATAAKLKKHEDKLQEATKKYAAFGVPRV